MAGAIEKIHAYERFGSVLGLERMEVLLEKLGNPHEKLQVIHVAGTNGKGSVCKFLEEGLQACGYKVGLYTSPFIHRFNERIRLGGEDISDADLESFAGRVLAAAEEMVAEGYDSPTEFEVVTSIALLYFYAKGAQITVLEVGLGGLGDSTNVVDAPLACAIASVSYDHMDRLGNTLEQIAAEKAGIIKAGSPVISNVSQREAAAVIARTAYEKGCRLYDVSGIPVDALEETPFGQKVSLELWEMDYSGVELSMSGSHQRENIKTALAVIEVLRKAGKIRVERSALYGGLKRAVQPGRFEVIRPGRLEAAGGILQDGLPGSLEESLPGGSPGALGRSLPEEQLDALQEPLPKEQPDALEEPLPEEQPDALQEPLLGPEGPAVILDGAHNEAGAEALQKTVRELFPEKRILLVTGMLADKQVEEILDHLVRITEDVIVTEPDNPRKLPADALARHFAKRGIRPKQATDATESVALAMELAKDYDVVLFAGSLYLIGDVRRILGNA